MSTFHYSFESLTVCRRPDPRDYARVIKAYLFFFLAAFFLVARFFLAMSVTSFLNYEV